MKVCPDCQTGIVLAEEKRRLTKAGPRETAPPLHPRWLVAFMVIPGVPGLVSNDVSIFDFQVITYIPLLRMLIGE
jgi:hypothetical protein